MPRLIDYVGRFEFIRQACFAVVRDEGPDALSRRRVAVELGSGVNTIRRLVAEWADLARLAADHVVTRRRAGRLHRRTDDPMEAVGYEIKSLMPEDATHLDEELVWLKLVACYGLKPSGLEPPGQVKRDFGIAQRGYDIELLQGPEITDTDGSTNGSTDGTTDGSCTPGSTERREVLRPYFEQHVDDLRVVVDRVLDLLGVPAAPAPRAERATLLIAVIEGLTLAACMGRIGPEEATDLAIRYATGRAPSGAD
jgi:hypothetical protein